MVLLTACDSDSAVCGGNDPHEPPAPVRLGQFLPRGRPHGVSASDRLLLAGTERACWLLRAQAQITQNRMAADRPEFHPAGAPKGGYFADTGMGVSHAV